MFVTDHRRDCDDRLAVAISEPLGLGRLPGDIVIERENVTFYFPIVTCLLLSLVFSVVIWATSR
jgi:Protein of unknown function (DUF2905)